MARTVLDGDLRNWEAFASTGPFGYSAHSRVVFRCTTDPDQRPRAFSVPGDKSDAESRVALASPAELLEMWAGADPIR